LLIPEECSDSRLRTIGVQSTCNGETVDLEIGASTLGTEGDNESAYKGEMEGL
jgi:hypothetical protein